MKFVNVITVAGTWTRKLPEDLTKGAIFYRTYAEKAKAECRRATVDIPPEVNAVCPEPCKRRNTKKKGILHKIKLKIVEGGTNFGTPFRRLKCEEKVCKEVALVESKPILVPALKPNLPPPRPGVQVSILGADTNLGQYIALLLKQCPCFKKLRLYEARKTCDFSLCKVCNDLRYINTNCLVDAFTCTNNELERCLQNTDIVLMLDNGNISMDMPLEDRFMYQAPLVKHYADVIATECPKAFIVVCASPIDCMVPLVAETLKETGWYDPRKLLGSLAVPEMRASTLAARALCLEPSYVRVPCVGGTEGDALVPLFSKAVDLFDFTLQNAEMMVQTIRDTPAGIARSEGDCIRAAELSEAHAIAGLVTKVAWALLCKDIPRLTAFVETDSSQIISPARFMANTVEITGSGIIRNLGLMRMSDNEATLLDLALGDMLMRQEMVRDWYMKYRCSSPRLDEFEDRFFTPKCYKRLQDCSYYANMFLGIQVLLNNEGIFKKFDIPHKLYPLELELLDVAFNSLTHNVQETLRWYNSYDDEVRRQIEAKTNFLNLSPNENDKLLNKLEENEPELATSPEEECVICVNAKATMQTSPCGHRVVCRRCFVKTIQMAVSQRLLPLRCVICRAKILRLRQTPRLVTSKSWQVSSGSGRSWGVPGSVSSYSVGARSVPASASLYSVTSGESSISGVSSASSNSGSTVTNNCSTKLCGGAKCGGACLGAVPRVPSTTAPPRPRQPASNSLRRSQTHSMKARLQDYQVHSYTGGPVAEPPGRLPPIREFQREFREGRRESVAPASSSTRIRCAQKIVTQLETSPQKNKQHFFRPLKPSNKDDPPKSRDHSKETDKKKENPKGKPKKEEKKKKEGDENAKQPEKTKKDESSDNKKNELAERKKEEKLRLKAEKEAKKEAKLQAKEEERQAKLLAKEEERQAKLLAKEEKKKAKKEAKIAAQAEKEKNKQN